MTSFLFDQSLPHGDLGDSTSAFILPQQSKQATRERSSSPLKQQQQHTEDENQQAEESMNPLRELSRLLGDKSTVTQHAPPSASAGERSMMAGNISQWALPQGYENMSNIMNASLPPSSQLLNAENTMAFDRSHFVPASASAATDDQSTANAGNMTTFNKLDSKGLDGTFLLDESLPHHLANVWSNISMFQPASSNSRLKKAPSKLVKHQPMILEEDGSGGEDNDEGDYSYVLPATPSSKPRQKPAHKGSLSPGKMVANQNRSPSQDSSSHHHQQQENDNQFLAPPVQSYSPPRPTTTSQTGSPQRMAATHQPVQLSHTRVQQTKRQSLGTHKRQSSLQGLPTKEAATAKNNLGSNHGGGPGKPSSSEGRVRSMLSRDSRSSPARSARASGMTPSASSSALRTPSKLSGAEAAARQQQQAERSARRAQTYEEFKEFLPALPQSASKAAPPAQGKSAGSGTGGPGIVRSRTTSSLSSLQQPQAGPSRQTSQAPPATVSRMPASRTSIDLGSQAQPARNPPATVSRMPISRTSTDLRSQGPPARVSRMPTARSSTDLRSQAQLAPQSGSASKRKAPTVTAPSPRTSTNSATAGGITRSQSTPSVSASPSAGPPPKKRVSLVPPKRTSDRPPPMPSSSSQTRLNQAMANKAPAPLGSRYGIPASTSASQLSGNSSAARRPSTSQQPRVRMLRPGESSALPTGTSGRSQPRQRL